MPQSLFDRCRRAGLVGPAVATLAGLAVLVALGTWQLQRKAWKERLIADVAERMARPPMLADGAVFATGTNGLAAFTRVALTGRFLHDKERYWFADGRLGSGFHVFTPLETAPAHVVWIDRGYVPKDLRDPRSRPAGQLPGTVTVIGLVHPAGERNAFTPANDVAHNIWFWRDLPALNASAFTPDVISAPVMVDAAAAPVNPGGWPEGGTTIVDLPNRHLEYVLTWYGLAAALIAVFLAFARSRLGRVSQ